MLALLLALGLALLLLAGASMVSGSAALARLLGVPPLVIGLTVVAFGTSAPELAVNVTAAVQGSGDVAFGNIIGSNLANVGLILAVSAIVSPLAVQSVVLTREIPMMLLASTAVVVMGFDSIRTADASQYDRAEGLVLLLLFTVFLYYTVVETLRKRGTDSLVQQARTRVPVERLGSIGASMALVAFGMVGLGLGGSLTVHGAVGIATALGASPDLIALTIVAVGTSLPELSASVIAARRGEADLAVGNVVGSNIFNLLFVLGVTASIQPVPVPAEGHPDLIAMLALAVAVLALAFGRRRIGRLQGGLLLLLYLGFVIWRIA